MTEDGEDEAYDLEERFFDIKSTVRSFLL